MPGNGRIFISHSHADNERCQPLLDALASWGADYWFDLAKLDVGQDLSDRIQRAIKERDVFIRVCSRGVQANPYWVNLETEAFRALQARDEQDGQHGKRILIPLLLDADYEMQPFELAALYLDAVHSTPDAWTARLHSALAARLGQGVQPFARVVDWRGGAQYHSIGEAIAAARPGDRILIHPGIYQEAVVIDRAVELVGDGSLGDVVIEIAGNNVVRFTATNGRIANLMLRQKGGGERNGINVAGGRLLIEDCDITSQGLACIGIHYGAEARVFRNRIHDGASTGVLVHDRGQPIIEDNEIAANAFNGIEVQGVGSSATIRKNSLHKNLGGVLVNEGAQANIEDNEIIANRFAGITVRNTGSSATIRENHLHDGKQAGVLVNEGAHAIIEDNEIAANELSGVEVKNAGSSAAVRRDRMRENQGGVTVHEGAHAIIEDNEINNSVRNTIEVRSAGSSARIRKNRLHDGKQSGVVVWEGAQAIIEDNEIAANAYNGVRATNVGSSITVRNNRVNRNQRMGVAVDDGAAASVIDNDLRDNQEGGLSIDDASQAKVRRERNLE